MAGLCPCWPCGRPERLAEDTEVLLACDLSVTSSRRPATSYPRHVWLLAEGLALFDQKPAKGVAAAPLEVVRLQQVASLRGRGEGSDLLRLDDTAGAWWELRAAPGGELPPKLGPALAERVDKFRKFRKSVRPGGVPRRSVRVSRAFSTMGAMKERRLSLRFASKRQDKVEAPQRKMGLLKRIAMSLPCSPGGDFADKVGGSRTPVRGACAAVQSRNVDVALLHRLTHIDLEESESLFWTHEAVSFILGAQEVPEDLNKDLSHTVRRGVPDGLKRIIWPLGAGVAPTFVAGRCPEAHERLLKRAFGEVLPERFDAAVPLFSQGIEGVEGAPDLPDVIPHLALLTEEGRVSLRRSLWCITLTHSRVEYCPMLPNLLMVLLVFFEESEAMVIVDNLLHKTADDRTDSPNPIMVLNADMLNRQAKQLLAEARKAYGAPEVIAHLEQLGLDVPAMLIRLLQDGLASALPFRALCRLLGAFLFEGSVAVLHYAMAVLKSTAPEVLKCQSSDACFAALRGLSTSLGGDPASIDRLTKLAFAAKLGGAFRQRVSMTLATNYVARRQDLSHVFCRPRLFEPRGSCPDALWQAIWPWVPEFCRVFDPKLVYTPSTDGRMVRTIFAKCKEYEGAPMVFFLYTAAGDILGGFSPIPWTRSANSGYVGCNSMQSCATSGHSFVFRMLKGRGDPPEIFPWTGRNEQLMMATEDIGLGFGGDGVAIGVDRDIVRGSTAASATFGSPCLLPQEEEGQGGGVSFELARFEVFLLS